ncbi:glycine zipper 2TM domain-containing protein [Sphingomonas sanguinis]|uniref:YMGG-like glycine zipper-containing protein n=1 Tax=Sphingomonas sanguinis TaxID=33051 RepID=UPI001C56B8FF|nr:YMGG-like glycine zipper-containing protein [Sphingomonas sanguinis]QXT34785.1 glycine zipper 2TM domain-containing protein [Sphingomonas sanguinis]
MRKIISMLAAAAMLTPAITVPVEAQRSRRDRVIVVQDPYRYDDGYDDGHHDGREAGYQRGYEDGRDDGTVTYAAQPCTRRKGKGAVIGALGGGLLGLLSSDSNKLANAAIGAAGGGLAGDLIGKRGKDYDC